MGAFPFINGIFLCAIFFAKYINKLRLEYRYKFELSHQNQSGKLIKPKLNLKSV